jgi:hypothetical protein
MVRDKQGMFIPCAHFLASNEDGDIIGAALEVLQEWTGGVHGWKLRYMLTDDSAAEQRDVPLAFTGKMSRWVIYYVLSTPAIHWIASFPEIISQQMRGSIEEHRASLRGGGERQWSHSTRISR